MKNASTEIIEKAYKVLVKKYHPDLQKDEKIKEVTEKRLKEINEAYDVLSNAFLKEQYDIELKKEKEEQFKKTYGETDYSTEKGIRSKKTIEEQPQKSVSNRRMGTFGGIIDFVKMLYNDRPKRQEYKEMTKKDYTRSYSMVYSFYKWLDKRTYF